MAFAHNICSQTIGWSEKRTYRQNLCTNRTLFVIILFVIIAGETSSGKSSTINLLFGMEVLPVHHNSCTSVITRISYGKKYSSTVVFTDGKTKTFTDPDRIKEDLWEMIYVQDQAGRDLVTSIKEVCMKIPSDFLKVRNRILNIE